MERKVKALLCPDGAIALKLGSYYNIYSDAYLAAADYFDYMDRGIRLPAGDGTTIFFTLCKLLEGDYVILGFEEIERRVVLSSGHDRDFFSYIVEIREMELEM